MNKRKPMYLIGIIALLVLAAIAFYLFSDYSDKIAAALAEIDLSDISTEKEVQAQAMATGRTLGIITIIPAVLTVLLAFITKEVVFSLFVGIISGYIVLESVSEADNLIAHMGGVFNSTCNNILNTTSDSFHAAIIILCLCIGGMVAVINASGGFAAMGEKITKNIDSPKRATIMVQLMGMCLFFDDYANSLITGPVMRSITDKQGVSREKLAYIVDSTAAPVAGIAIISSWIAAEISAIESGFAMAGIEGSAYAHFFGSIPFCFYNILAIAFVMELSLTGREYGPMLKAERRARMGESQKKESKSTEDNEKDEIEANLKIGSIWSAVLPIATMVVYSLVGFYINGMENAIEAGIVKAGTGFSFGIITTAFGNANTVAVLMRASILASIVAISAGCYTGKFNIKGGINAWIKGLSDIMLTALILVLAWSLSAVIAELGTAYYLVDIVTLSLPHWLLPLIVFITCCFISFVAGSFGCMVIVMPIAVPLAYSSAAAAGIGYQSQYIFACIAAVLSGSIFGDHCSPVTDTTILSSLGAGCDNLDHVKTQLPYALTVAAIVSFVGYLPAGFGVTPWISIPVAIATGLYIIRLVGKKVDSTSVITE